MKNQTPKTAPAAVELACIQCGAPYPALPGSNGLCPACAQKAARTAVCAKCGKPFALPRGGRWPKTCPACRVPKRNRGQGPRGQYFGDKAPRHQRRQSGSRAAAPQAEGQRPRRQAGGAAGRPGQGERPAGKEGTAAPELRKVRAAVWEVMAGAAIPALWPDAGGVPVLPAGQPVKDQLCAGDGAGGLLCRGV